MCIYQLLLLSRLEIYVKSNEKINVVSTKSYIMIFSLDLPFAPFVFSL
jgi:hypothetical protein